MFPKVPSRGPRHPCPLSYFIIRQRPQGHARLHRQNIWNKVWFGLELEKRWSSAFSAVDRRLCGNDGRASCKPCCCHYRHSLARHPISPLFPDIYISFRVQDSSLVRFGQRVCVLMPYSGTVLAADRASPGQQFCCGSARRAPKTHCRFRCILPGEGVLGCVS